jgi:putative ABC transport system permease protein
LNWKDANEAIGHKFQWILPNSVLKSGKIIGVVQNFNITPLKSQVQPLVIHYMANLLQYMFIRFNQAAYEHINTRVQQQFKILFPKQSIEYTMLDETMNRMYISEQKLGQLFTYFSVLAIVIACIGVLGLSLNSIQQRFKEIGIRKVLGGSVLSISSELIKEFLVPVFVASLIATPIAWTIMNKWLQDFAYKVSIDIWLFVLTAVGVLLLSILTMGYQSVRAANANPIKSLRTE